MSALLPLLLVLGSAPSSSFRPVPAPLTLEGGLETVGVAWAPAGGWFAEAHFAWQDAHLDLRGGRTWPLFEFGVFGADLQASPSLTATTRGPFDLGAGVHGTARLRLTFQWLHLALGAQAGGELFARDLLIRAPLRAFFGVTVPVGKLQLGAGGKAGVDLSPQYAPTVRYDALGFIGYSFGAL